MNEFKTILLLGSGGLLGAAFARELAGENIRTAGRSQLDGVDQDAIAQLVEGADLVINCAADVNADAAESDDSIAVAANIRLPAMLGAACARRGARLVQFSSTGCYGNWKAEPYVESDPTKPTTRHHQTKLEGEDAVRASGADYLIARVGWLFGGPPGSRRDFVWQRLLEARAGYMRSDSAQCGCPTNVSDVVGQTFVALRAGVHGTINLVSEGGGASRVDYVREVVRAADLSCTVEAGPSFVRAAPVSPNETALNARLAELGVNVMPSWQEGIARHIGALRATPEWRVIAEPV